MQFGLDATNSRIISPRLTTLWLCGAKLADLGELGHQAVRKFFSDQHVLRASARQRLIGLDLPGFVNMVGDPILLSVRLHVRSPRPPYAFDHESASASPSRLGRGRWGGANSAAKWAPANSINPERKAQNMRVTEIEKGPYASWKSSQGSALM
jgi:hypothetical protein